MWVTPLFTPVTLYLPLSVSEGVCGSLRRGRFSPSSSDVSAKVYVMYDIIVIIISHLLSDHFQLREFMCCTSEEIITIINK